MFWRKWPPASKLFAAIALVCGAAAFLLVHAEAARVEALRPGAPVRLVVAARDLAAGTELDPAALREAVIPSSFAPPGTFGRMAAVSGRTLLAPIASGEALTETRVSAARGGPVAGLVPPGLRAFALAAVVPPGSVVEGDRVDVFATFTSGAPHTELVAEAVQVIARVSGAESGSGSEPAPSLEILVSPEDASQLAYASAFAQISVALLGPTDASSPTAPSPSP